MTTLIYIVTTERKSEDGLTASYGGRSWFWNRTEADNKFFELKESSGDSLDITVYEANAEAMINDFLDGLDESEEDLASVGYGSIIRSHEAPKTPEEAAVEYTTLEPRHGVLSIERTEGDDVWQYRVTNRLQNQWCVFDTTVNERIGYVYFTTEDGLPTFEVSDRRTGDAEVNRDSLQAAVEYIIERDISGE